MHCIVPRIALAFAKKNVPSRIEWHDLLEVGLMLCNIIRILKKIEEVSESYQEEKQYAI